MQEAFVYDERLGVDVLRDDLDWTKYTEEQRGKIHSKWALLCSSMTNRVSELEDLIREKLVELYLVKTEDEMHEVNNKMMDLASIICDLNILSRSVNMDLAKAHF